MTDLADNERAHLTNFVTLRPEWAVCVLSERMVDEEMGSRAHKYGRAHPYITGMYYVLKYLRELGGCTVLDIGSPISQNIAVAAMPGVNLTVLDVREHDDAGALGLNWSVGNATNIPYHDGTVEVVTSLWVMGHVGDGRYGDELDADGDRKMLAEIARVLKPGGTAIIGPGLLAPDCGYIYNLHRIYNWAWLRAAFDAAGFDVVDEQELFVPDDIFMEGSIAAKRDGVYALVQLRKR